MATAKLSAADQELTRRVLDLPVNRAHALELLAQEEGGCFAAFEAGTNVVEPSGTLASGILHAMAESICSLALLPQLLPGERGVTHDFHASVLRPVFRGQRVELRVQVRRKGKTLAVVDAEGWIEDRLCYLARATKSIAPAKE